MSLFSELPGLPTLICLAGVALMIAIVLLRTQRYYARHTDAPPSLAPEPRAGTSPQPHAIGVPAPMVEWEVQMHETARALSAQLDSKMAALEHLIREADRAAARLETAIAAAQRVGDPASDATERLQRLASASSPGDPRPVSQAESLQPRLREVERGEAALPSQEQGAPLSPPRPPREERYEPIYTLADYGYDAPEIAHRTGTPLGEVQLILSLRGQRQE